MCGDLLSVLPSLAHPPLIVVVVELTWLSKRVQRSYGGGPLSVTTNLKAHTRGSGTGFEEAVYALFLLVVENVPVQAADDYERGHEQQQFPVKHLVQAAAPQEQQLGESRAAGRRHL